MPSRTTSFQNGSSAGSSMKVPSISVVMTTPGKPSSTEQRLSSRSASGPPSGLAWAPPMKRPG